ncbi:MAG: nucleotidyl transferase AbiEii/AbiGii toxin family protein [bacterium]|nr:nucleotidyl transferase AbiEii/AbiGii toxin family protein [bacterium]
MYKNILNSDQENLLPLVKSFSSNYYLVGGTAIALHVGHRRSIDFDLFTDNSFDSMKIRTKLLTNYKIDQTFSQGLGELTILINKVKVTFFHYPFIIDRPVDFDGFITLPDLLTLGAMKAFALGRRAKWKDYVDLYFIFQKYSFQELIIKTSSIFKSEFNEKLFRTQLGYFDDIDHSEEIEYMAGFEKKDEDIKKFLEKISLS